MSRLPAATPRPLGSQYWAFRTGPLELTGQSDVELGQLRIGKVRWVYGRGGVVTMEATLPALQQTTVVLLSGSSVCVGYASCIKMQKS